MFFLFFLIEWNIIIVSIDVTLKQNLNKTHFFNFFQFRDQYISHDLVQTSKVDLTLNVREVHINYTL